MSDRSTLEQALSARHNSLNFIRLVLALIVVVSHSNGFGRWHNWDGVNRLTLGTLAVYGFFAISGYLIAGSALRNRPGRYLWQRFLRIFPGFWVCLIVTAFGLGVIAWLTTPHTCHGLSCYFHASDSPWGYVYNNFFLQINQPSTGGLPMGHYDPLEWRIWNGSLWTLTYEFVCYLVLAALAVLGLLRRRGLVLAITTGLILVIAAMTFVPGWDFQSYYSSHQTLFVMNLMRLSSVFLVGSVLYLYRDWVPDSGWIALGFAALFIATLWLPNEGRVPQTTFTAATLFAPAIAYPMLWLGAHLPLQRVGSRNDYSYGIYIYAFPVQQLLAMWGVISWGYLAYTGMAVVLTAPLAMASWWGVEKHALRLKGVTLRRTRIAPLTTSPAESPLSSSLDVAGQQPSPATEAGVQ